jgi:hypothetical protein
MSIVERSTNQNPDGRIIFWARRDRAQTLKPLIVEFQLIDGAVKARAIMCWRHRGPKHSLIVLPTRRPAAYAPQRSDRLLDARLPVKQGQFVTYAVQLSGSPR